MLNPYLPCTEFIPDGEPHLFQGRVYLYGSHDIYGEKGLCQGDYVCWSADEENLENWRYEGVIYRRMQDPYIAEVVSRGKGTMLNQYLYAPDVVQIGEAFYLYYGVAMSGAGIAVAKAESPAGPFTYLGRVRYPEEARPAGWKDPFGGLFQGDRILGDGMPMVQLNPLKKHFGIHMKNYVYDPAVMFDEGHLYLYFGCGYCYVAELSTEDMRTLVKREDTGEYVTGPLLPASGQKADKKKIQAQDGWHMGNGASVRKIGGRYYLSYYGVKENGGNAICYSTSDSPWGPFRYGGVLVALGNMGYQGQKQPTAHVGNTHGGMCRIKGRWYQNYHRQTGDKWSARQACMAELIMDEKGNFQQAEYLSQVEAEGGIPWDTEVPAYSACVLTDASGMTKKGKAPFFACREKCQVVKGLRQGAVTGFKYLDFQEGGAKSCAVKMSHTCQGKVKIYLDKISGGTVIGEIPVGESQNGEAVFQGELKTDCRGIHGVYFCFYGQKAGSSEFISFRFQK